MSLASRVVVAWKKPFVWSVITISAIVKLFDCLNIHSHVEVSAVSTAKNLQ